MFIFKETPNPSASIWIINEQNSTPLNTDIQQSSVRIMWYRFLLVISKCSLLMLFFFILLSMTYKGNTTIDSRGLYARLILLANDKLT
jgi:hypothetical protein